MVFGMPTLIETESLEECAVLCKSLGLDFIEISMSLPQYTNDSIDVSQFMSIAKKYDIFYTLHLDENVNFCDFNSYVSKACVQYISDTIKLAKMLDVQIINMHFYRGEHFTLPERKVDLFDIYKEHYLTKILEFKNILSGKPPRKYTMSAVWIFCAADSLVSVK